MKIPYFHVDAFAGRLFGGNPAGVCVLAEAISDELQQVSNDVIEEQLPIEFLG